MTDWGFNETTTKREIEHYDKTVMQPTEQEAVTRHIKGLPFLLSFYFFTFAP